jgi:hypothetical protein
VDVKATIIAAVPEPGPGSLIALGLVALAIRADHKITRASAAPDRLTARRAASPRAGEPVGARVPWVGCNQLSGHAPAGSIPGSPFGVKP